ncbi:MAG: HAD hydrolase-like protein [Bacillota bacterium]|nr:HAD hydrolase-like protein [Bacillota bacterium]
MYKSVMFDLDGTLTDSYEAIVSSFEYALNREGIVPIRDEAVRRSYIGPALKMSFEKHYGVSPEKADKLVEIYREVYRNGNMFKVKVYGGIPEMLDKLKKEKIRLFVTTSKPEIFSVSILEKIGLAKYFDKIEGTTFDNCHRTKDMLINAVAERFSLDKQQCLMVGDTCYDIEGGILAGVDTLGVTYGYGAEGDFANATYTADNPAEIIKIVEGDLKCVK